MQTDDDKGPTCWEVVWKAEPRWPLSEKDHEKMCDAKRDNQDPYMTYANLRGISRQDAKREIMALSYGNPCERSRATYGVPLFAAQPAGSPKESTAEINLRIDLKMVNSLNDRLSEEIRELREELKELEPLRERQEWINTHTAGERVVHDLEAMHDLLEDDIQDHCPASLNFQELLEMRSAVVELLSAVDHELDLRRPAQIEKEREEQRIRDEKRGHEKRIQVREELARRQKNTQIPFGHEDED